MHALFKKRYTSVGAKPGTLVIAEDAPPPRINMIDYGPSGPARETKIEDVSELQVAHQEGTVTWVDVQGLGDEEVVKAIGKTFSLHPLLLEDVVNVPQRPKVEAYQEQLLLIVRMVSPDPEEEFLLEQVSIVLGPTYVVTFQERYDDVLDPVRRRIRGGKGAIRSQGADYLAYAIADAVVDAYYPVLERVGERLEHMEDVVVEHPTPQVLQQLNRLKNRLSNLRRAIWPQREAINHILRGEHEAISRDVRLYFRDVYDHSIQTTEVTEMYREMTTSLMNTYLSAVANRTNEVMKVLTIVGTTFIPMTFLAGVYGMNFQNMPELHSSWGYPLVCTAMAATAIGMLAFFWRKGWIGPDREA